MAKQYSNDDLENYWLEVWYFVKENWQLFINIKNKLSFKQFISWFKNKMKDEYKEQKMLKKHTKK